MESLSADEKRLFCRMVEVYAGFLAHADHHIGRLLDYLEESGQRRTPWSSQVSDNGASGESGPDGSVNEMLFANGIPDNIQANPAMLTSWWDQDLQPLPERLGDGVQHAIRCGSVRVQRRHRRPVHHLLALATGVATGKGELRHQHHHAIDIADHLDTLAVDTRHDQGPRTEPLDGVICYSVEMVFGAVSPQDVALLDAGRAASGTTAGRRSPRIQLSPGGVTSTMTPELYHRHRPRRVARPGR